jgi:signal transduction histidine kinase
MESWLTSVLARTFFTYLAQAILGLVLYFLLNYFSKLYKRKFLRTWAFSWLAFFAFMFSTAWIVFLGIGQTSLSSRLLLNLISMTASYWHVALILIGCYELTKGKPFTNRQFVLVLSVILFVSTGLMLVKASAADGQLIRYAIRVGLKYFIISIGFFLAFLSLRNPVFTKGVGRKILTSSFLLYSLLNFYYGFVVAYNVFVGQHEFPLFFGLIELLSITLTALGMSIWLLEDERMQLKKANQELDSFLYSVSHDLRAPIASILGLTHLARLETTDAKVTPYVSMIEQRIKKLDAVIGDILQLSRSSKSELKKELIDFNNLMEETASDLRFNEGADKIELHYIPSPDHIFTSDRTQVKIILSNLFSNAVKYHRVDQPNPFIQVSLQKKDSWISVAVSDNGEGIAPDNQDKIFEMFFRASTNSEGTGLGLYIVKEAVTKLKGKIELHSQLGVGSTFTVTIPAQ